MTIYSLLDRLLLWQKFIILSVVALILASIPTYLYMSEANKGLEAAILEQQGLIPVATILKVVQLTQQHRGLSALALGEVAGSSEKRKAKQREADQAYDSMSAIIEGLDNNKAIAEAWQKARQDWESLRTNVSNRSISIPESYAAHTALVPKLLTVNELVADRFQFNLDSDLDSYQLIQAIFYIQPYLTEEMGKMRAKGAGLLAKKAATLEDRLIMSMIIARTNDRLAQMVSAFNKSTVVNPAIQSKLGDRMREASQLAQQAMQLATEKIVTPEVPDYSSVDYVNFTTQAIDAQFSVNVLAAKELEAMLGEKVANFQMVRWTMTGMMAGLIIFAGFILYLIARSVSMPLAKAVAVSQRVATGDLSSDIPTLGVSETAQLLRALKAMNDSLVKIVGEVRVSIDAIGSASDDIASGNTDLSARTESQASSLEETASSMEQITTTVKQNANSAKQANQLVAATSDMAVKGGQVVSQVVQTMGEINDSSRKIVDIISVIDGIAFQTNILALNAAVEAARAGEEGRGFAVVASEVRNLAQRSAGAAKEIKSLINDSVEKVDAGNKLVAQAGKSMDEIVASVKHVTEIMSEIVMASLQQSENIEQINQAISQMDEMTQQNSALVEQSAAAAESLKDQAHRLVQSIGVFKLNDHQLKTTAVQQPAGITRSSKRSQPVQSVAASMQGAPKPARKMDAIAGSHGEWEQF